jgi:hypothetical protein
VARTFGLTYSEYLPISLFPFLADSGTNELLAKQGGVFVNKNLTSIVPGAFLWTRTGTNLFPATAGDDVGSTGNRINKIWSTNEQVTTNITLDSLTVSTILASDASKNIVSLPLTTYPSLTELSYVKGVTSAIQTQIDTKANKQIPTAIKVANYTAVVGDIVICDISAGSFTVTLPSAPADKSGIRVKVIASGASKRLIVQAGGTDTINLVGGTTSKILSLLDEAVYLQYQSATGVWFILSADAPPENFATNFTGIDSTTPISASDISINYTNRILTITPPLGYFYYYTDGIGVVNKHIITGNLNFPAFTDTSGIWYFYLDASGNAISSQTKYTSLDQVSTVARVLWNATLAGSAKSIVESYDANLNTSPTYTRTWLERYGTIVNSGGVVASNVLPSGTPNADGRNAVIGLTTLNNLNANLPYTITNSTGGLIWQQDLGNTTPGSLNATNSALFPIRYQDVSGLAYVLPATRFPFDWNSGTNIPNYITSTGTRTPVTNLYFFVYYVYSFQDARNGQGLRLTSDIIQYATLADAQLASWSDIQNIYLTLNDPAIRPLYKLTFKYNSNWDVGTKYSVLKEVVDLRSVRLTTQTVASGSINASSVINAPAGNITSTNVQNALNELDTLKVNYNGLAGGQTIIGGTLTTQALNLRSNLVDLTTGSINFLDTLEASSPTVGAVTIAGGLAVNKRIYATNLTVTNQIIGSINKSANVIGGNLTTLLGSIPYQSNTDTTLFINNTTTTKKFLVETGTGTNGGVPLFGTISAGDVPTLNQNTTGTAAGLSATLAIASGGTGITSYTQGDMLYAGPSGVLAKLPDVAIGSVLCSGGVGANPIWATNPTFNISNYMTQSVRIDVNSGGTLDNNSQYVMCNSVIPTIFTLPAVASNSGRLYIIKNKTSKLVTINTTSSELIDNNLTITLQQWESVTLICDGSTWNII